MKRCNLLAALCLAVVFSLFSCKKEETSNVQVKTIDFENLTPGNQGYWNGSDLSEQFQSSGMIFNNEFDVNYHSWAGFAYSLKADVTTPGVGNQFSVYDPANGTNKFALYYPPFGPDAFAGFPTGEAKTIRGIEVCNSTYTALSMKNGDDYAKKFGGPNGNDPDWFKMTVIGYNTAGDSIGFVDFYLADYRFSDNSRDYIINKWTPVNLSTLGKVNKITFRFSSTDNSSWGMNTPAMVCLDNLKYEE